MPPRILPSALGAAFLLACGGDAPPPPEPEVAVVQALPNIPLPPNGQPLASERGETAAQLLVSTPMHADSVAEFYRTLLSQPPYRLVNEATANAVTSFFVEQDGPPLWVTVEGLPAGGTLVRLAGAAVRETVATPPASDTTS
jgi:hypothetical protein